MYYAGIDIGSSYTKAMVIGQDGQPVSWAVQKTGVDFTAASNDTFNRALNEKDIEFSKVKNIVSTGVGRACCKFKSSTKTEIGCLAKGGYFQANKACVIIDIGGQDNKAIKLLENGVQESFKMNRKCAAGTGSFLEEIAFRLDLDTAAMNEIASTAEQAIPINSYCTVFAGTEVIHRLRQQVDTPGIMRGVFDSVAQRVLEMTSMDKPILLTGGAVGKNPILVKAFQDKVEQEVWLSKSPQMVCAWGAALIARDKLY